MPLTKKGSKIKSAMTSEYGEKKGKQVFYASINKGRITGAEKGMHWKDHDIPGKGDLIGGRTSHQEGVYRYAGGDHFKDAVTTKK